MKWEGWNKEVDTWASRKWPRDNVCPGIDHDLSLNIFWHTPMDNRSQLNLREKHWMKCDETKLRNSITKFFLHSLFVFEFLCVDVQTSECFCLPSTTLQCTLSINSNQHHSSYSHTILLYQHIWVWFWGMNEMQTWTVLLESWTTPRMWITIITEEVTASMVFPTFIPSPTQILPKVLTNSLFSSFTTQHFLFHLSCTDKLNFAECNFVIQRH